MANTTPSNSTGLRYAEEVIGTPGVLPGAPVWNPLEPNSYADFGPQVRTVARAPISASRQRRKGVVVDVDAVAGFNSDFVQKTLYDLMQGFMFANWRAKKSEPVTSVSGGTLAYDVASGGTNFGSNTLVFAEGFANAANNGLKFVISSTSTTVTVSGLVAEASPPAGARITQVGYQGTADDLELTVTGGVATLTSTLLNFTWLTVIPGEWIWIGGDTAATQFATAANNGFYRVRTVSANAIVFDRAPNNVATDDGDSKTIRLFIGHIIKNEAVEAQQVPRTYQLERYLGPSKYEYLQGSMPNTFVVNVATADKITVDMTFVSMDGSQQASAKTGTRPGLPRQNYAFNSSSDFTRLRLLNDTAGGSLATYLQNLTLTIDNGVTPAKAISNIGAIDLVPGDFAVSGTVEAFFSTIDSVQAVRNNADVSLDFALVAKNCGWLFDIPLITLGDARLRVEKDRPIILPLSMDAAAHEVMDHTLLAMFYPYLPNAAQ